MTVLFEMNGDPALVTGWQLAWWSLMALMLLSNLAPLEALNSNGDIERARENKASS
jgi:hypothetical protein